jgi:hypothetical protein
VTVADLRRCASGRRRVAMPVATIADLRACRRRRRRRRMAMPVMAITDLCRPRRRRGVMVVMDARLGRAGEGDRSGDKGDGPGVYGSDHAIS